MTTHGRTPFPRWNVKTVSVAEFKRHLSEMLGQVAYSKEVVLITRRGRPMARVVPADAGGTSLADVVGWLEDDDAFFDYLDEAARARRRHMPRAVKSR
jgi:prevent-host-death family protein